MLDLFYCLVCLIALPWVALRRLSGGRPVAAPWRRAIGPRPACSRNAGEADGNLSDAPMKFGRGDRPTPSPASGAPAGPARIWLHGVSVGEVNLLHRLAASLRLDAAAAGEPEPECVVSSSTTTGLALAEARFGVELVFPAPLDFSWAVARSLDAVAPDLLVLGELEIWPNLLAAAAGRGIPVVVANGRLSPRSFRGYRRLAWVTGPAFGRLTMVLARSEQDAGRFRTLGARHVEVTGSMKFDGVEGDRLAPEVRRLADLAGIADEPVFLAGSTQAPEEAAAIEAFLSARGGEPRLRLVIVPRHVERAGEVAALLDRSGLRWRLRSRLQEEGPDPLSPVILVDTTGELAHWWGLATVAFVGGSLDGRRGGQNMLEPAAYGAAVCFGPHTQNFREEAGMLTAARAAEVVADPRALQDFVCRCLADPIAAAAMGQRARELVARQRGAVSRTARRILEILSDRRTASVSVAGTGPPAARGRLRHTDTGPGAER
jgi:3-deoxy-D-manno-octulosonic-acid transferase